MIPGRLETVAVYADLDHFDKPVSMGSLRCQSGRTGDIFSSSTTLYGCRSLRRLRLTRIWH